MHCQIKNDWNLPVVLFGGDEENRTPVRNLVLRDNLRVQSTDELFLFPRGPSTGVGSSSFIRLKSLAGAKLNR